MRVFIFTLLFAFFFAFVEVCKRRYLLNPEITRKLVHVMAGVAVAGLPWVMSFREIQVLSLIFIVVMLASRQVNLYSSIHSVSRSTYGEVYFPLAALALATFFPSNQTFAYGMLIMSICDALANIIGERFGQSKYQIGRSQKSYIGSTSFFVSAWIISLLTLPASTTALLISASMAAVLTLSEGVLSGGLDNLILPVLAACLLTVALST